MEFLVLPQAMLRVPPRAPSTHFVRQRALFAGLILFSILASAAPPARGAQAPASQSTVPGPSAPRQRPQKPQPAPQLTPPPAGGEAPLEADQQRKVRNIYYADGHVDLVYQAARLRADHLEYNTDTDVIIARGNVKLDYVTQHIEAAHARYERRTSRGTFHHVHATFALQRRPSPTLLISPNPLYFEAEEADRLNENTYQIHKAWLTVCDPSHPTWKFYAPLATVRLQKSVHLENGNFRVFSVPVLYLPYATFPAEKRRDS